MLQDKEIPDLDEESLLDDSAATAGQSADAKTLTSQVSELIEDVRILALAEAEYYRAKLSVNLVATKRVLLLFGMSIIFGTGALVALILGTLLILAKYLGPLAATAVVTGSSLLIAAVLMGMATRRARKLPLDEHDA
ncbi:phage holin family protein [Parasphingorhabdus sp.]|uniref:phage holin family protein n=1 Tax=Parasphingorhabdus sp. TaxID=2709688 RepID=UPI003002A198